MQEQRVKARAPRTRPTATPSVPGVHRRHADRRDPDAAPRPREAGATTSTPRRRRQPAAAATDALGRGRVVPPSQRPGEAELGVRTGRSRPGSRSPSAARSDRVTGAVDAAWRCSQRWSSTSRTSRSRGSSSRTSRRCSPTTPRFAAVVDALADGRPRRVGPAAVDQVVGIEARGFILAAPVALALGAGFVPVRKAGKLPRATYARVLRAGVRRGDPRGAPRRALRRASGCCSSTTCSPPAAPSPPPGELVERLRGRRSRRRGADGAELPARPRGRSATCRCTVLHDRLSRRPRRVDW